MARKRKPRHEEAFEQAHQALVTATRLTFHDYHRQFPGETFYAFALYADNYARGRSPAAQTEEAYQRRLAKNTTYGPGELGLLRYCPDEWDMSYCGTEHHSEWDRITEILDPVLDDKSLTWEQAARPVFEMMTQTLADLDAEGVFGQGADREAITLLIWITDSGLAEEWWARSVQRLNPPSVYERFLASGIPEDYRS